MFSVVSLIIQSRSMASTADSEGSSFEGKEVYVKKAGEYFEKLPPPGTSVDSLIRTVFAKSRQFWGYEGDYAVLIGYVDTQNKMHIFSGDQLNQEVTLTDEDMLIIFSNPLIKPLEAALSDHFLLNFIF